MTDTLFTVPPVLTERQAHVYQLTQNGPVSAVQAGVAWHTHRTQWCPCAPERPCQYASMDGRKTLEALRHLGLLRRDRHHNYRRVNKTSSQMAETDNDWGGF